METTYDKPSQGWTCFHCGETFTTPGAARDHFGSNPLAEPGCLLKVSVGGERGLLLALRKAEELLARHMEEDTDLHRTMHQMQSRHSTSLMSAEEAGYARGLADGMKEPRVGSITISAKALREALEFCNPDGPEDEDQLETEVTIWLREEEGVDQEDGSPLPKGLYCHLSEYPEEGCIPLFEIITKA